MTQKALKLALESMKRIDAWLIQRGYTGLMPKEKEAITALEEALAQPAQQEPVALQDDEIYDAAYSAYCRGENSRELFRIMWNSRLTCSIGWDRDELKSFARNIAAIYIHPREKNQ